MADTTHSGESARNALFTLLAERGYRSVFDVVRQPRSEFVASLGERTDGAAIYAAAERRAGDVVRVRDALLARQEPAGRALKKLGADNDAKRLGQLGLSDEFDYEHWFRQTGHFVADTSVASLFSPASYLVDLYRRAVTLHAVGDALHLDARRPDIADLALSQTNLDREIATIDVVNDVLLARIGNPEKLTEAPYPFRLPYDHDATTLDRAMQALSTSGWDIVRALTLADNPWYLDFADDTEVATAFMRRFPAEWARSALGLCPQTYAMLTSAGIDGWASWWNGDAEVPTPSELRDRTGLTMAAIHDLLGTDPIWFWRTNADGEHEAIASTPRDYLARYINQPEAGASEPVAIAVGDDTTAEALTNATPERLDRLQRIVRLQRATALDFDVLDYLVTSKHSTNAAITALPRIAQMQALQRHLSLDAWDYAFLTGVMHAYYQGGEPSRVERWFGRDVAALLNRTHHPAIDFEGAIAGVDEASRNVRAALCRGLAIDDVVLTRLIGRYCETTQLAASALPLTFAVPSALFRVCRTATLIGCSIDDLLSLWDHMSRQGKWIASVMFGRAEEPDRELLSQGAPIVLEATLQVARWLIERKLGLPLLLGIVSPTRTLAPTPEIEALILSIRHGTSDPATGASLTSGEQEAATVQLSRLVAAALGGPANVAAAMLRWMDRVIPLMDPLLKRYSMLGFWADAHRESAGGEAIITPTMVRYCHMLGRFTIACQFAGLTEHDIDLVVAPPGDSPLTGDQPPGLDLESVRWLGEYAAWRDSLPGAPAEAVQWLSSSPVFSTDTATTIARLHAWDVAATQEAIASQGHADGDAVDFRALHRIWQWMRASNRHLLSPRQLHDLIRLSDAADPMDVETKQWRTRAAAFVSAAAHARSARGRHTRLDGELAEHLRTACVAHEIPKVADIVDGKISTPEDLYEFLLIDPQVSSVVTTSRIAEAIASVQLYINRCREGMEPGVVATALADLEKEGSYFSLWDTYYKRYGSWAGLQRLLRYPATYIEPSLRYRKTRAFSVLEERLSEGRLTAAAAEAAFLAFVRDTTVMLDLIWLDGFQVGGDEGPAWFLAQERSATERYYWRHTRSGTSEQTLDWSDWKPINAPIRAMARRPSIVHFAGKLRVAWVEWKEMRLGSDIPGSLWSSARAERGNGILEAYVPPPVISPAPATRGEGECETKGETALAAFLMLATCDSGNTWSVASFPLEATPFVEPVPLKSLEWFYVSTYPGGDGEHLVAIVSDEKSDEASAFTRVLDLNARLLPTDLSNGRFNISTPGYGDSRLVRRALIFNSVATSYAAIDLPSFLQLTFEVDNAKSELSWTVRVEKKMEYVGFRYSFNGTTFSEHMFDPSVGEFVNRTRPLNDTSLLHSWYCIDDQTTYTGSIDAGTELHFDEQNKDYSELRGAYNNGWTYLDVMGPTDRLSLSTYLGPHLAARAELGSDRVLDYELQSMAIEPPASYSPEYRPPSFRGAVGMYMYELFLHAPFLIASRLIDERRFDEAETWLRRLFSPAGYRNSEGQPILAKDKPLYWNVRPLQEDETWGGDPVDDTDDPDAIAAADPMHYKLAIFLRWLKLYVDRGDEAYRQQTRDTLAEAKMWYARAAQMLGPRPHFLEHPANLWSDAKVKAASQWTDDDLAALDVALDPDLASRGARARPFLIEGDFQPPVDTALLRWWDVVDLRLHNLRHGLSLDGLPMLLPLYETPVDPRDLQNRRMAGDAGQGLIGLPGHATPPHRFTVAMDRARAAVQTLVQFGSGLSIALERKDSHALTVLHQQNQVALHEMARSVHERNMASLEHAIESTVIGKNAALERARHFAQEAAEFISPLELAATTTRTAAGALVAASAPAFIIAGGLEMAPNMFIGGMAFGVGGSKWGGLAGGIANSLALIGQSLESHAANIETSAQYVRRADDWRREAKEAEATRAALEKQELSQRASLDAARRQLAQMDAEQAFAEGVLDVLGSRFTSQAFYHWQAARMSTLYYQLYDACLGLCAQAQAAYAFETSDNTVYIKPGAWDDQYQGLLAGEHLTLSLQRLEQAWMERDVRVMEIERTLALSSLTGEVSLSELIADALDATSRPFAGLDVSYQENILRLAFVLSDAKLMEDYPDNMGVGEIRRIKSIAVTLPALLGPFEDIRAVLGYTGGAASSLAEGCTAVAISRGLADSGQFILDFHDGRYLPFEGIPIGDGGTFALSFPNTEGHSQEEMLRSITDVILHIRYTARSSAS